MSSPTGLGRVRIRPSAFGIVAAIALVTVAALRPSANDPPLAAMTWVVAVVVIVLGILWPLWAVRLVRVGLAGPVPDADVGSVVAVPVEVRGSVLGLELSWSHGESGWYRAMGTFRGEIPMRPSRRGVRTDLELFVRTAGPLALLTATRPVRLPLPRPMCVGPEPGHLDYPVRLRTADANPRLAAPSGGPELVRSVRPYVPGDPAHLVHWPTTARVGAPMVRELEAPAGQGLVVVVDLNDPDGRWPREQVEQAVRRTDAIVRHALHSGVEVTLATAEGERPVTASCRDLAALRRRLAAATSGPLHVPVDGRLPAEWITP